MDSLARIQTHFANSIAIQQQTLSSAGAAIVQATERIAHCLAYQGKVLVCGEGAAAAAAQHFAAAMLNRVGRERPGLPVLALMPAAAMVSVTDLTEIFARQVRTLGEGGDVLVTLATGANPPALVAAITAAQARGLVTVALTGQAEEHPTGSGESDVDIRIPGVSPAHILEVQFLIIHCLCELIECLVSAEES